MDELTKNQVELILNAIKGIEYGSINITIHDSQITQIDRLEKIRFPIHKNKLKKKSD